MQYGLPFQAIFSSTDPRIRNKLVTGTLLVLASMILSGVLIGIVGFLIVGGYSLRLLRQVQTHQEHPLPEWNQWETDLRNGFFMFVAYVVWLLPFIVVSIVVSSVMDSLAVLLSAVVSLILGPAITIAFAQRMQLADAFKFRNVLDWVVRNWVQCLLVSVVAFLVAFLISLAAVLAGALALGIGLLVTLPFGFLMSSIYQYHLFGQLAQSHDLTVMFPEPTNSG